MLAIYLKVILIMTVLFLFIVPGFVLRKRKMLNETAAETLSTILLYVCLPAMTISAFCIFSDESYAIIQAIPRLRLVRNFAVVLGLTVAALFLMYGIGRLAFRREPNRKMANLYCFASIFSNCGFVGLPFIQMFTDNNPLAVMYMMVFNVAFNVVNWTLGVVLVTGDRRSINLKKILLNPTIIASFVAMLLFFVPELNFFRYEGLEQLSMVPQYLTYTTSVISMMIVGVRMADMKPRQLFCQKGVYKTAFLRLIVSPAVTFLLTIPLWGLFGSGSASNYEEYVYLAPIIAMSISPAAAVVAMAEKFGGDKETAAATFVTTTLLSIITIPLVLCAVLALCGISL